MKVYTIGYTGKTAEEFFSILMDKKVRFMVDIRLNNTSQLAGYTKKGDLPYFLDKIAGIEYRHDLRFSPTKELFAGYKDGVLNWEAYEAEYQNIIQDRNLQNVITQEYLEKLDGLCLLCSEATATHCHRSLVADLIGEIASEVEIMHI